MPSSAASQSRKARQYFCASCVLLGSSAQATATPMMHTLAKPKAAIRMRVTVLPFRCALLVATRHQRDDYPSSKTKAHSTAQCKSRASLMARTLSERRCQARRRAAKPGLNSPLRRDVTSRRNTSHDSGGGDYPGCQGRCKSSFCTKCSASELSGHQPGGREGLIIGKWSLLVGH